MIALILVEEEIRGKKVSIVSHGINVDTLQPVILPNEPLIYFDTIKHPDYGYCLSEELEKRITK